MELAPRAKAEADQVSRAAMDLAARFLARRGQGDQLVFEREHVPLTPDGRRQLVITVEEYWRP